MHATVGERGSHRGHVVGVGEDRAALEVELEMRLQLLRGLDMLRVKGTSVLLLSQRKPYARHSVMFSQEGRAEGREQKDWVRTMK